MIVYLVCKSSILIEPSIEFNVKLKSLQNRVGIDHVSAHTGVRGYETADALVKEANAKLYIDILLSF